MDNQPWSLIINHDLGLDDDIALEEDVVFVFTLRSDSAVIGASLNLTVEDDDSMYCVISRN